MQRHSDVNNRAKILAKPSGITLEEHVSNVMSEAANVEELRQFVFEKYLSVVGKSLSIRLQKAVEYHDDGKTSGKWQDACRKDYKAFQEWQKVNRGTIKDYEKEVGAKSGLHLRNAGVRHELQSLKMISNLKPPLFMQVSIAAHHSKLGERFEERWISEGCSELWKYFKKASSKVSDEFCFKAALRSQYEVAGPRSLLQFVDRRASAREGGDSVPQLNKFSYRFPHATKRGVQKLIEKHWQDDLLLVRAPTGAGKTDASLLWAQLQIENNRADRLIIAMPTRFTSNALAINVAESLSDTGLYHSSAWFTKFEENVESQEVSRKEATKQHEYARLLQTPITVCTIDHLMVALTLTREDHHHITFNMANSCLVIDEADFYDDFTQANINVLLEALKEWKVPVLLMSASLPKCVLPQYQSIGFSIEDITEDVSDNDRCRFYVDSITKCSEIDETEDVLNECIAKGAAIIYANTVDRAMMFYDYFIEHGASATVYHSRFTEPHKKEKEAILIQQLGREAWEVGTANGIAILTQIGEMSINISADIMVSDICPIDRLTQRAGRLCRFDKKKKGKLHLLLPYKNELLYPAPYGEYDRLKKAWIPAKALLKTIEAMKLKEYSPNMLVKLLNLIYSNTVDFSPSSKDNASKLKDNFRCNWLINPLQRTADDDSDTNLWKSRNIAPQDYIFTQKPQTRFFRNYMEFQAWKLRTAVNIPIYLIKKYQQNKIIDTIKITIGEDSSNIFIIREGFYSFEKGISLPETNQFL